MDHVHRALRETLLPYSITPTALSAIEIAPAWVQMDMVLNLQYLTTSVQNDLGALLLSLTDPRTVDEVAWLLVMLMEPLSVYLMTRPIGGKDLACRGTCLAALYGLVDDVRMEAEGLAEELGVDVDGWWDEEPCSFRVSAPR